MMTLPFFGLFAGLMLGWMGQRLPAIALWVLSAGATLALFKMHATDSLPLAF